jgi:hypothetical protein
MVERAAAVLLVAATGVLAAPAEGAKRCSQLHDLDARRRAAVLHVRPLMT